MSVTDITILISVLVLAALYLLRGKIAALTAWHLVSLIAASALAGYVFWRLGFLPKYIDGKEVDGAMAAVLFSLWPFLLLAPIMFFYSERAFTAKLTERVNSPELKKRLDELNPDKSETPAPSGNVEEKIAELLKQNKK